MSEAEANGNTGQTALAIVVSGRVQGVGYRFFCQRKAHEYGVGGWARNCPDGTVQVMAVGPAVAVKGFVAELGRGPRFGKVEDVSVADITTNGAIATNTAKYESGQFSIR